MISQCLDCGKLFEDCYRSPLCPHDAFPANDGYNNFVVHDDAFLSEEQPPIEPECPPGRKPHKQRVADIVRLLPLGKTGAVCIDNTFAHRAWYLYEIAKYKQLEVVYKNDLSRDMYLIKVKKVCD